MPGLGRADGVHRALGHLEPFAVHLMVGQPLCAHRLEGARAHVQRHGGGLHALGLQRRQHLVVEVQRRRRRGHGAGVAGEDGLVALGVLDRVGIDLGVLLALDVGRQRQVAELVHQLPGRFAVGAGQGKAEQRTALVGPAAQQHGVKAAALEATAQVDAGAGQGLLADLHVGHDFVALQHALDQQLQLATAGLLAKDARLDHLGVVEHQQVALVQQPGQVLEDTVHQLRRACIQQAGGAALGSRVLGNQVLGEHKVEIAERVRAGAERHACA